jgi:hypothetical protein
VQIRPCAEFTAVFPDDSIEEDGDIVQFGGRGVAEAMAAMLQDAGFDVSTPEHHFEHGWDFDVKTQRKRVWIQITEIGDVFVLASKFYGGTFPRRSDEEVYSDVLTRLNAGLACDVRFSKVRWQHLRDVLSGAPGGASPVIE